MRAEFDYEARALSDKETSAYLNGQKRVYLISVAEAGGGSFTPDEYAIEAGKDLTVTMEPDLGYYLTDFKLNGASAYDYVKRYGRQIHRSRVPKSPATSCLTRRSGTSPRGNDRKTVNVTVRSDVPQAGIMFRRENRNPRRRKPASSVYARVHGRRVVRAYASVAGTTLTDGVTASGKYSFTVTAQGYHVASKKITLTADSVRSRRISISYLCGGRRSESGRSVYVSSTTSLKAIGRSTILTRTAQSNRSIK
ncbi:MAG: hypothetical protein ACLUSP_11300 [Christensenellales bacterium]